MGGKGLNGTHRPRAYAEGVNILRRNERQKNKTCESQSVGSDNSGLQQYTAESLGAK